MRNRIIEETLSEALSRLRRLLPSTWSTDIAPSSGGRADATFSLKGPGNASALLDVAVKRWTTAPTSKVVGALSGVQRTTPNPVLLVTDYTNRSASSDSGDSAAAGTAKAEKKPETAATDKPADKPAASESSAKPS